MQILNKIYLMGIKPTRVHLGHLLSVIELSNTLCAENEVYCLFADIHRLSTTIDFSHIDDMSNSMINLFDSRINCYKQSANIENIFEAYLLFSSLVQVKDMQKVFELNEFYSNNNFLMYSYPLLMALDIILMAPCEVVVGPDQIHNVRLVKKLLSYIEKSLEISYEISFKFSDVKIRNLISDSKMSTTTEGEEGCIYIDLDSEEIKERIMKSKTQSKKPNKFSEVEPSLNNIYLIYSLIKNIPVEKVFYSLKHESFSSLKNIVSNTVIDYIDLLKSKKNNSGFLNENVKKRYDFNMSLLREKTRKT